MRGRYQDVNIYFPERLARICNEMGVKNLLHVSALQQNLKHRSEWARTKVGIRRDDNGQAKGEEVIREVKPETCIVRPADMFGEDDRILQWWNVNVSDEMQDWSSVPYLSMVDQYQWWSCSETACLVWRCGYCDSEVLYEP